MSRNDSIMSSTSLPTPAPSTEILPSKKGSLTDSSFTLPPAAIPGHTSDSISTPSPVNSDSSYHPLSPPPNPKSPATSRRRSSTVVHQSNAPVGQNAYTLPPPPTRSRKIIQMKPRGQSDTQAPLIAPTKVPASPAAAPSNVQTNAGKTSPATAGAKRKQPNGTNTAAGRKIARKTAHSLIERRRRSKMNEEFGVLKDMIPACTGQEMHKLAILQASIEYMRYLEQCLLDLKTAHDHSGTTRTQLPSFAEVRQHAAAEIPVFHDSDSDEEMSEATYPQSTRPYSAAASSIQSNRPSISPAIMPSTQTSPEIFSKNAMYRQHSAYSSAHPSPAFEPQTQAGGPGYSSFALTSPALGPQPDGSKGLEKDDHEATAALLMLNTDRRSWSGPTAPDGGRGMSVKDLLSG